MIHLRHLSRALLFPSLPLPSSSLILLSLTVLHPALLFLTLLPQYHNHHRKALLHPPLPPHNQQYLHLHFLHHHCQESISSTFSTTSIPSTTARINKTIISTSTSSASTITLIVRVGGGEGGLGGANGIVLPYTCPPTPSQDR